MTLVEDPGPLDDEPTEEEFATPTPKRRTTGSAVPVLAGMMLAVGEIIEPEKTHVELTVENSKPVDEDPLELDFGALPPLD